MGANATILVVDDEADVREVLEEYLVGHGYAAIPAASASEARGIAAAQLVDLALIDINMPGEDGLSLARHLRERYARIAVVMLTSASTVVDRIVGLEMGADDYLAKPFNPRELVARIQAVLRRHGEYVVPGAPAEEGSIPFGRHTLDLAARKLSFEGRSVSLTSGEFSLLRVFAQHPRQPLAREKLMVLARGRDHELFDRAIDVQVSRLRKLVEPDPANPRYIQTVWGFGYVYMPDSPETGEPAEAAPGGNAS